MAGAKVKNDVERAKARMTPSSILIQALKVRREARKSSRQRQDVQHTSIKTKRKLDYTTDFNCSDCQMAVLGIEPRLARSWGSKSELSGETTT